MNEREIRELVAEFLNIRPSSDYYDPEDGDDDEDDYLDPDGYDWTSGCNHDGVWVNGNLIVKIVKEALQEVGRYEGK